MAGQSKKIGIKKLTAHCLTGKKDKKETFLDTMVVSSTVGSFENVNFWRPLDID